MDITILKEIGMTDAEIKVYLMLLKSGSSRVSKISKATNVERTEVYHILENLARKSLVSHVIKEKIRYFRASKPEKLKELLKRKEDLIDELLPELNRMQNTEENYFSIEFLKEEGGRKTALYDLIKYKTNYYVIGNTGRHSDRDWWPSINWNKRRIERGVRRYLLDTKPPVGKYPLTETRILPKAVPEPKIPIVIYNTDRILVFISQHSIVRVISKEIHDLFKEYFDTLWAISKPYKRTRNY